jgi:predicted transcriptional regulator
MNTRTLISLPDDDKLRLDREASARGRPMTHLVQDAVAEYRVRSTT